MRFNRLSGLALATLLIAGCVDHDYDLSKDIDLTIAVGGNLALPGSSTETLTLAQILDLDANSSIRPATAGEYGLAEGDYVLVQEGTPTNTKINIPYQNLHRIKGSTAETDLDAFYDKGEPVSSVHADQSLNIIDIRDDDVTDELVSVSSADLDVDVDFSVSYRSHDFSGTVYIEEGYVIEFDEGWKVEIDDAATSTFLKMISDHVMVFTRRVSADASSSVNARLKLVGVDFSKLPAGQGLYERGHFRLDGEVRSYGLVSIDASNIGASGMANITFVTNTNVENARIVGIRGIVDPHVTVNPTSYRLTGIPDFLSDGTNRLDVLNPRFTLAVTNNSPVPVEINAALTSHFSNREPVTVGFGSNYGTAMAVAAANATTKIIVSRLAVNTVAGELNVVVPDLGKLLETVPTEVIVDDIKVKALQQEVYLSLDTDYSFDTDCNVVVPLQFGHELLFNYSGDSSDWATDLSDYGFHSADGSVVYFNTLPMDMQVSAVALDHQGNELNDVQVNVTGTIAAGTVASPSSGLLTMRFTCSSANLSRLNGIRYLFSGTYGEHVSECTFNSAQSIRFEDLKLRLNDGIILNLND